MMLISPPVLREIIRCGEDTEDLLDALNEIGNLLTGAVNTSADQVVSHKSGAKLLHFKQVETLVLGSTTEAQEWAATLSEQRYKAVSFQFQVEDFEQAELLLLFGRGNFEKTAPHRLGKPAAVSHAGACTDPTGSVKATVTSPSGQTLPPRSVRTFTLGKLATSHLQTAHPETKVGEAMHLLREKGISHLPVVDETGKLVGIISKEALLGVRSIFLTHKLKHHCEPKDKCTVEFPIRLFMRKATTLPESARIKQVLAVQEQESDHVIVAVNEQGRPSGIFTTTDLLRLLTARLSE